MIRPASKLAWPVDEKGGFGRRFCLEKRKDEAASAAFFVGERQGNCPVVQRAWRLTVQLDISRGRAMLIYRTSSACMVALLCACGGGGSAEQAPPPVLNIAVLSGDRGRVMQHVKLTPATELAVAARNAQGVGVPGLPVTFSPAADNAHIDTVTVATGADGAATWQGFPHGAGPQKIIASDAQHRATITGTAYRYVYDTVPTGAELEASPFTCTRDA
jgi:hypothetical protein